ncbi:MAG TPA: cytochrome c [Verrucomicrobiae bacterium]|nr:cytochrome c [Verrucomicrobiae bacterium]
MKKTLIVAAFLAAFCTLAHAGDSAETWEKTCAKCHGPDGKGDTKMGKKLDIKDLTDTKFQESLTDDQAFKAVKEGVKDSEGKVKMKPAEGLSDDDIKGMIAYVRKFKK